jgi:hypothetical protein
VAQLFTTWKTQWQSSFTQRFPGDGKPNPVGKTPGFPARNESYLSYPANATVVRASNVVFIELENAYAAVRSLANPLPGNPANDGNLTRQMIIDAAPAGNLCGFVLEAANKTPNFTFADFQAAITAKNGLDKSQVAAGKLRYISLANDTVDAVYGANGVHREPIFDWGFGPSTPQNFQTTPPYLQPTTFPTTNGGRVASWSVNGDPVVLDGNWPVYQGPGVSLSNQILRFERDSAGLNTFYQVNYTGSVPVFTSGIVTNTRQVRNEPLPKVWVVPNPARSFFTLTLENHRVPEKVELFTLSGRKVKEFASLSEGAQYELKGIKQGIYFLRIHSGNSVIGRKLVVE